jgi:hypothetical protein
VFAFPVLASWKDSLDGGDGYLSPYALVFRTRRGGSSKVVLRVERLSERLRRSAALHDEAALYHDGAAEYWAARKEPGRAEIERRSAELERAQAKLERDRADLEEREEAAEIL